MLYDLGFFIFSVFYLPILIFKGKLHKDFPERFGKFDKEKAAALLAGDRRIWIQAVSVGEVALCKSLIPALKESFPANEIVISTITKAGNDLAKKIFSKDAIIIYFPLDFTSVVRKALELIKPKLYIMIETEIWPNLLKELSRDMVPAALINGRISDRSVNKYRLVKPFLKNALNSISVFCMQDAIDASRITELGANPAKVKVTGNMKFDAPLTVNAVQPESSRRSLGLGPQDELLVGGSTHSGEEKILIEAFKNLKPEFPNLRLLIAPRHINRVGKIESIIKKFGFKPVRVSSLHNTQHLPGRPGRLNTQILILDTIGHLNEAYSVAALVFMGGSLVKHGGQNPIEPALLGKPVIFGPHMFNFRYVTNAFLKKRAVIQVAGKEELTGRCRSLLNDPKERNTLGENAKTTVSEERGATKKNVEAMFNIA